MSKMAAAGSDKARLAETVLSTIKACLNSVKADIGLPMETLAKDYRELEGRAIPFRELEHATLASFLQSVPEEIQLRNRGGQLFVSVVRGKTNAQHIKQLVQGQASAKRGKNSRHRPLPRHPKVTSVWNPPTRPHARNTGITRRIEHQWQEPFKPFPGPNYPRPKPGVNQHQPLFGRGPNPARIQQNKPGLLPTPDVSKLPNQVKPNNPVKANNPAKTVVNPAKPSVNPAANKQGGGLYYNDGTWVIPRAIRNNQDKQFAPYYEVPPRFSAGKDEGSKTFKQRLEEEVEARFGTGEKLVFRTIPGGKKTQYWISTVTMQDQKFSSYPEESARPQDAEELVARKALEHLQTIKRPHTLPVQSDLALCTRRVKKVLSEHNSFLWWEYVRDQYQRQFNEVLPEDWVRRVDLAAEGFEHQKMDNARLTLRLAQTQWSEPRATPTPTTPVTPTAPITPTPTTPSTPLAPTSYLGQHLVGRASPTPADAHSLYNQAKQQAVDAARPRNTSRGSGGSSPLPPGGSSVLPPLDLPMSNCWDICVNYIHDFTIKFRLIGDQYSNAYEELITNMELHYMEERHLSPVAAPAQGHVYALAHDESWFRVQLTSLKGDKAQVYFLDHGDEEEVDVANIHNLEKAFLQLPAQAMSGSLAGLEFAGRGDQAALNLLQTMALGQTLVGQVVARAPQVSLILFNTSTDDDININEKVLQQLDLSMVDPALPKEGGVAEVYVLHMSTGGDVYVQVETETYRMLENLLEMARNRTEEILGDKGVLDPTRLYLAQFSQDGQWYRAAPRSKVDSQGKVLMWFVDFGNSDQVPVTAIRPLDGPHERLNKIPHQALVCRLHNVPGAGLGWTERACQRFMDLLPQDSPLLLKVQSSGGDGPPLVELFKRLEPQNELVSINATLALDSALFRSEGDSNNNSVNKEVILSPSRSRSRRSSDNSLASGANSGPSSMNSCDGLPSSPRPGTLQPKQLPQVGSYFDVYVTFAASPTNFAVQSWKLMGKLSSMMQEMQQHYASPANLTQQVDIQAGEFYAIRHSDDLWYRAQVNMHQGGIVSGIFVDYGDCCIVTPDKVQPLAPAYHSLPYQAIKARLSGISAANLDWMPEDTCRFRDLVEYREFVSVVTQVERNGDEVLLHLRLIDTSDPNLDVFIDQILVDEGRAVRV